MKLFTGLQIKEIDLYTIKEEPISSLDLMERAAQNIFDLIIKKYFTDTNILIFSGCGNNGGDGLALARMLHEAGYSVRVYLVMISPSLSPDCKLNFERISKIENIQKTVVKHISEIGSFRGELIIDALFGTGLTRPLEDLALQIVQKINSSGCRVISIDVPSGLYCEDNTYNNPEGIVKATETITLQFPKLSFFFSENQKYIGEWNIVNIGLHEQAIKETNSPFLLQESSDIGHNLKKREKFSHKGNFGHALLIAGGFGKMGAAILAARSCMRSGAGLLTTYIPACGYDVIQISVPESMVVTDSCEDYISELSDLSNYSAIGIGPGIGTHEMTSDVLKRLIQTTKVPMVIDADGLNILAENKNWLKKLPNNTILTPHPKEFDRLAGVSTTSYERFIKAKEFSEKFNTILVLKGAYTQLFFPDGKVCFNSTGNPGMATGGSGDVLTGIILGFLAQGYRNEEAACLGVYLHGLSGDIALKNLGENSLIAGDIINYLPEAFMSL